MKPNNAVALIMLCCLLAAGGSIVHNYSEAHAAASGRATPPPSPFPELSRKFCSASYLECPQQEECEYMALFEQAKEEKNLYRIHALQAAHRQHLVSSKKAYAAYMTAHGHLPVFYRNRTKGNFQMLKRLCIMRPEKRLRAD
ncbi:hypothetical protein CCAX7_15370 [Capsulimonas corticalis]|uniref:Uncharacterized protein n=1 Tax=Capsulimonas corticalis TaxID=2219043 RepID=A0A402CZC6_9BACT|nr:hypothetical protein [Capsulimonas corticalis]BDI29486.1 hypothetical protein CCAX7_15370 [Capsulimonas corticalis]